MNLVEYTADSREELSAGLARLVDTPALMRPAAAWATTWRWAMMQ